jgi:hypothetical protein
VSGNKRMGVNLLIPENDQTTDLILEQPLFQG